MCVLHVLMFVVLDLCKSCGIPPSSPSLPSSLSPFLPPFFPLSLPLSFPPSLRSVCTVVEVLRLFTILAVDMAFHPHLLSTSKPATQPGKPPIDYFLSFCHLMCSSFNFFSLLSLFSSLFPSSSFLLPYPVSFPSSSSSFVISSGPGIMVVRVVYTVSAMLWTVLLLRTVSNAGNHETTKQHTS